MEIFRTIAALRQELSAKPRPMGFVPTMGALHAGHARLIETSVRANPTTAVSIFVNPSQFNDPVDFDKYPRTLETDVELCESVGADLVFAPPVEEIYPLQSQATLVDIARVTEH